MLKANCEQQQKRPARAITAPYENMLPLEQGKGQT